ncbi:MAG: hypothetical protein QE284_12060 [Rhizobium sp.]|nr:hypothetical protein [Rhizobium sp.]
MRVDTASSSLFSGPRNLAGTRTEPQEFEAMLSARTADTREATDDSAEGEALDFTSMTRQELFDWMNEQLRSGEMSFDESSPFLGMTLKISAATGEPVDMATDMSRIDFTEKARQGIDFYQSHFDYASADALQAALDRMLGSR